MVKRFIGSISSKDIALFVFLTLGYFVAARIGIKMSIVRPYGVPIWLPAGGAMAALILCGYRVWPAVFIGSFLGHATALGLVRATFISPFAATLEGLAGAYLVIEYAHGVRAFDTAKDVLRFVFFTCLCAPSINAVSAFITNYYIVHLDATNSAIMMVHWWLVNSVGILVVTPFLILLFRGSHHPVGPSERIELTILGLGLLFVCLLVFGPLSLTLNKSHVVQPWLCVPFLIWAGFRFCQLEAAGATFILFISAYWGTMHGYGSFVSKRLIISYALLESFVGVIGTMTLVVAALVVERRQSAIGLLKVQTALKAAVEGKTREMAERANALKLEITGHEQTLRLLRDNQERARRLAENAKLRERANEGQVQKEPLKG